MALQIVVEYYAEIAQREATSGPLSVLSLDAPLPAAGVRPSGSVSIIWAEADSPQLAAIREAVEAREPARLTELLDGPPEIGPQPAVHPETARFASVLALADVTYDGTSLAEALTYIPNSTGVAAMHLAYTGGPIDHSLFRTSSHCLSGASPVGVLVILNPPLASPREVQLLSALPSVPSDSHVLAIAECTPAATPAATFVARTVTAGAVAKTADYAAHKVNHWAQNVERNQAHANRQQQAREHAAARAYPGYGLRIEGGEIPEAVIEQLEALDPASSVKELLAIRAGLLS